MATTMELWEINVSGRVQGVGFRYFTKKLASGLKIAGYSMNLPDGNVMLEIEGDTSELKKFCERLHDGPGRVNVVSVTKKDATGNFKQFEIRF